MRSLLMNYLFNSLNCHTLPTQTTPCLDRLVKTYSTICVTVTVSSKYNKYNSSDLPLDCIAASLVTHSGNGADAKIQIDILCLNCSYGEK